MSKNEKKVIYGVWDGDYEDRYCAGLFEVKEDAEEYKEQVCPDGWIKEMELNSATPHEKGWRSHTVEIREDEFIELFPAQELERDYCFESELSMGEKIRVFCFKFSGVGMTKELAEEKAQKLLKKIKLSVGDLSELEEYEPINYQLLGIKKEEI